MRNGSWSIVWMTYFLEPRLRWKGTRNVHNDSTKVTIIQSELLDHEGKFHPVFGKHESITRHSVGHIVGHTCRSPKPRNVPRRFQKPVLKVLKDPGVEQPSHSLQFVEACKCGKCRNLKLGEKCKNLIYFFNVDSSLIDVNALMSLILSWGSDSFM